MAPNTVLRADAPEFRLMECGKHFRPRQLPEYSPYLEPSDRYRYRRRLLPGEKRGDCLCDYHHFPELLEERTKASDVETPKKPFRLFDLPAELRIRIYECALVPDDAIELCPEPYCYSSLGFKHKREDDWRDVYQRTESRCKNTMKQSVAAGLGLLRVNKRLHSETAPVFWGENEFRFSNITGWVALDFFLHKIGLDKVKMLRKLTVCHPDCCFVPTSLKQAMDFRDGSPFFYMGETKEPGFVYETRWFDEGASRDPVLILQKAGKLKQLRLVSPVNTVSPAHEDIKFVSNPFDVTCFDRLEVTVVSLRVPKPIKMDLFTRFAPELKDRRAAKRMARRRFQQTGEMWKYEDVVVDELGRY